MSFFTGYYIGKQISKSIKEEQQKQQFYQDLNEWAENHEKEKAREERKRRREEEKRRAGIISSSTERAKKEFSELREELKEAMDYDVDWYVSSYVNTQLSVSYEIEPGQALGTYNSKDLYDYAWELQNNDMKNAVISEYDNLKPSLKKRIPKNLFIEEYMDWLSISRDLDPTGKYEFGIIREGDTIEVLERVEIEMKSNPYIDYEIENNFENNNETNELDELERWFSLYEKGAITLEEYQTAKNNILGKSAVEKKKENLISSTSGTEYESGFNDNEKSTTIVQDSINENEKSTTIVCHVCGKKQEDSSNRFCQYCFSCLSEDINEEDLDYDL